jgi:hypothetical protein
MNVAKIWEENDLCEELKLGHTSNVSATTIG